MLWLQRSTRIVSVPTVLSLVAACQCASTPQTAALDASASHTRDAAVFMCWSCTWCVCASTVFGAWRRKDVKRAAREALAGHSRLVDRWSDLTAQEHAWFLEHQGTTHSMHRKKLCVFLILFLGVVGVHCCLMRLSGLETSLVMHAR
jgi:hypothetical protein